MQVVIGGPLLKKAVEELKGMRVCPYCYHMRVTIVRHGGGACGYCNNAKCDREHDHGMCAGCLMDWIERTYEVSDQ